MTISKKRRVTLIAAPLVGFLLNDPGTSANSGDGLSCSAGLAYVNTESRSYKLNEKSRCFHVAHGGLWQRWPGSDIPSPGQIWIGDLRFIGDTIIQVPKRTN